MLAPHVERLRSSLRFGRAPRFASDRLVSLDVVVNNPVTGMTAIRLARIADVPTILRFIRALAEYGRNPDEAEVRSAKVVENYKG